METGRDLIIVPAWLIQLRVEEELREYCIDNYFPFYVDTIYRRILFVYPGGSCKPIPSSSTTIVSEHSDADRLIKLIVDGCKEAERLTSLGPHRPSLLRIALLLGPSRDEVKSMEARIARELCSTVFGEEIRPPLSIAARKAYIEYPVGDKKNKLWQRLSKLARVDKGIANRLSSLLTAES